MSFVVLACRACGASIEPGPRASLSGARAVLLDVACDACGKRALYESNASGA